MDVADWALVVLAATTTVFTLCYLIGQPWWKERVSIIYLGKSILLSLVLLQISASVWAGSDYPGRAWIRLTLYSGGSLMMFALLVMLLVLQHRTRRDRWALGDYRHQWEIWRDEIRNAIARMHGTR
ncbi:putative phage holin [Gordonia terrae]|uniref:putative phage holin n=1 Tax=Gordonia terrae TaxID=2055 RepID=UPI003F6C3884